MRTDELERELRAERPEPGGDFARRLDEWAQAGFPRDDGLGPRLRDRGGWLDRLRHRLALTPPRKLLLPVGATATLAVVAGVAIGRVGSGGDGSAVAPVQSTVARGGEKSDSSTPLSDSSIQEGTGSASSGSASTPENELAVPDVVVPAPPGGDGIAQGVDRRVVDASARLTLGAPADEVQDVANRVVEVTDGYDGVVIDSQVTSDQSGARAAFELQIPARHLDAALSDLSDLADVVSRTESARDITAQAVRARRGLARTLDRIRAARIDLIRADTAQERLVIRSRIASLEATADAQRTALRGVRRQGRFATVAVEVSSSGASTGDGDWTLGDAVDDARRALEVIGGVALVSLAILLPVALLVALVAAIAVAARRRGRQRALDG